MAIPKRVWSNKRVVWHDEQFQVYQKDGKLQYQDRKGLWHEVGWWELLSYEEIIAMSREDRITALNKAPVEYLEKFTAEWKMSGNALVDDLYTQWDELGQIWVVWSR